jgi:hypothetical protein
MDWIVPVAIVANTVLLLGGIIVGGRLLLPSARRLADHLDRVLKEKHAATSSAAELARVMEELQTTRAQPARVLEQQQFLEALLQERKEPTRLPPS